MASSRLSSVVMNAEKSMPERLAAFANRASWIAPLGTTSYTDQINNMIHHFDHLGVVEVNPGPTDDAGKAVFPPFIQVEDQHIPIADDDAKTERKTMLGHASMVEHGPVTGGLSEAPARRELTGYESIEKLRRWGRGSHR